MLPRYFTGTFVRLAPNHVSIADPDALQIVYAHGNGSLKSDYYDAFFSIHRNIFNTRDRADHARKRKIVSQIYSLKSVLEFEPYIRLHTEELLRQWDNLAEGGKKSLSGEEGKGWFGTGGWVWYDCLPCKFTPPCLDPTKTDISNLRIHLQGIITSRSTLSVTPPSARPSVCSRPRKISPP